MAPSKEEAGEQVQPSGLVFKRIMMPDGDVYVGTVLGEDEDVYHGTGVCTYANGDRYCGQWCRGVRDGWGRMEWCDGEVYEGVWEQGEAREGADGHEGGLEGKYQGHGGGRTLSETHHMNATPAACATAATTTNAKAATPQGYATFSSSSSSSSSSVPGSNRNDTSNGAGARTANEEAEVEGMTPRSREAVEKGSGGWGILWNGAVGGSGGGAEQHVKDQGLVGGCCAKRDDTSDENFRIIVESPAPLSTPREKCGGPVISSWGEASRTGQGQQQQQQRNVEQQRRPLSALRAGEANTRAGNSSTNAGMSSYEAMQRLTAQRREMEIADHKARSGGVNKVAGKEDGGRSRPRPGQRDVFEICLPAVGFLQHPIQHKSSRSSLYPCTSLSLVKSIPSLSPSLFLTRLCLPESKPSNTKILYPTRSRTSATATISHAPHLSAPPPPRRTPPLRYRTFSTGWEKLFPM